VRRYQQRLLFAVACSIAIHEVVIGAGGFLRMEQEPVAKDVPATRIVLEVHTPAPTPTPQPRSTPALLASVAAPRATTIAIHTGGSKQRTVRPTVLHKESVPISPASAPGASGIAGTGDGSGSGSESDAGGGTGGNSSGVANATAPCGSPVFYRIHAQYNPKDGSFDDTIRVKLTLGSGEKLDGVFPYTWHYPSEADDPFSPATKNDDPAVEAKLPPPGFDASREPPAVQLTLAKTLPNGMTLFDPCPPGVGDHL